MASGAVDVGRPEDPGAGASRLAADLLEMLSVGASDALPRWVAEHCARRHPNARRRVLRVHPGKVARSRANPRYAVFSVEDPALAEPLLLAGIDALMVEAIGGARPLVAETAAGASRVLVAFVANGEARYLVELSGAFDADDLGGLERFAALATRYYERLVEAETDPLTRLANRRAFHAHLDSGLRRWVGSGRQFHFALLDIDRFKHVNDDFGHLYGDEILVHFARLMRETFRAGDLLYRFGGEEFVAIYGVDPGAAGDASLERFRAAVEAYAFPGVGRITVSIGHARIADGLMPATTLIERADRAVYFAKTHGRNRVCGWEALLAEGLIREPSPPRDVTYFQGD